MLTCDHCGAHHPTTAQAIRCDYLLGRPSPGLTTEQQREIAFGAYPSWDKASS